MSAEIIQFIPRPRHDSEQTDFPTIAFRSVVRDLATDRVDAAPANMSSRKVEKPKCQKTSPKSARWRGATPEPRSMSSSGHAKQGCDARRARFGGQRHSRSRLGQGHAARWRAARTAQLELIHQIERVIVHPEMPTLTFRQRGSLSRCSQPARYKAAFGGQRLGKIAGLGQDSRARGPLIRSPGLHPSPLISSCHFTSQSGALKTSRGSSGGEHLAGSRRQGHRCRNAGRTAANSPRRY